MAVQKKPVTTRVRKTAEVKSPAIETPVVQAPAVKAPVIETLVVKTPVMEAPTRKDPVKTASAVDPVISVEAIQAKAFELWQLRGRREGFAEQDWKDAEAMLKAEAMRKVPSKSVTVVSEQPPLRLVRVA